MKSEAVLIRFPYGKLLSFSTRSCFPTVDLGLQEVKILLAQYYARVDWYLLLLVLFIFLGGIVAHALFPPRLYSLLY